MANVNADLINDLNSILGRATPVPSDYDDDDDDEMKDSLDRLLQRDREKVPTKPFTGREPVEEGGYVDEDDPFAQRIKSSTTYQNMAPHERRVYLRNALDKENKRRYGEQGTALIGGEGTFLGDTLGIEARTQQGVDRKGESKTYFVPKSRDDAFTRSITGGILNTVKGVLSLLESGTDKLRITDPGTNYIDKNFPEMPAEGAIEKTVQEIIPIVAGAVSGGAAAKALTESFGLSAKLANKIARKWDELEKFSPSGKKSRLERWIKYFFMERGASIGAAAMTPKDVDPWLGDDAARYLGITNESHVRNIGHYIDNEAFSIIGRIAFNSIGKVGSFINERFIPSLRRDSPNRRVKAALLLIKDIDPELQNAPPEILAKSARILGEVALKNKEFELGLLGQKIVKSRYDGSSSIVDILPGGGLSLDTGTALALGTKEYVRKAHGWKRETMTAPEFDEYVTRTANEMVNNIVGLKQSRRGSPLVQRGEAAINRDAARVLEETAEGAIKGGKARTEEVGRMLGEEIATPVRESFKKKGALEERVSVAEDVASAVQDKDAVLGLLKEARDKNVLGDSPIEKQTFEQLASEDLLKGFEKSRDKYTRAFNNLPEGISVDVEDFKNLISTLSEETDNFRSITSSESDTLRKLFSSLKKAENVDLKTLYTELRPALSRRIKSIKAAKNPLPNGLVRLKEWIDEAAESSGHKEFKEAMDLYKDYANTYLRTEPLRRYAERASKLTSLEVIPGVRMGQEDAYEYGMRALDESMQAKSSGYMEAFINALNRSSDKNVSNDLAEAYVGMAMGALTRGTEKSSRVSSSSIKSAIQPYIKQIRKVSPETASKFEDTVKQVEMAESGLIDAKTAFARSQLDYQNTLRNARERAASNFVSDLGGSYPEAVESPGRFFANIFKSDKAPDLVEDLLKQAGESGNSLIVDGIKSKYISYIKDKIFSHKRMAVEVGDEGISATRELSPNQLSSILSEDFDNTLQVLYKIFSDEPQKAQAVTQLLEVLDVAVNNRAIRGNSFGSTTVLDEQLKEKMNRLIIMTLGVLNPVATKARNISAALSDRRQKEMAYIIEVHIDRMITHPWYFADVMELVKKKLPNENQKSYLRGIFGRGIGAQTNDESEYPGDIDSQTRKAFN